MRKPKYPNAERVIDEFYSAVSDSYKSPGPGEIGDNSDRKKLQLVADEFDISRIKVRKILITTGDLEYPETENIQKLQIKGKTVSEIGSMLNMSKSTINSFLPYKRGVYKLEEVSAAADKMKRYRERKAAVNTLLDCIVNNTVNWKSILWEAIIAFQGYPFHTSGRGSRSGVKFCYNVSVKTGDRGSRYDGDCIKGYGNELIVKGKNKPISRSTVERAWENAVKMDRIVPGPESLGVPGAHSYLYAMFLRFGIIINE